MLKILRKKGVAKKVLWGIAIVIIISFGFFGTANYTNSPSGPSFAGKIFGKKIPIEKFEKAYQRTRLQAFLRYGENFNKISSFLNLEAETWDRLILLQEAEKANIKIADAEVVATIEKFPYFQRDGQFDSLLYNDVLRYVFKIDARGFEESIRESLKLDKLFTEKTGWVTLSSDEIYEAYKAKNEKIQISYIAFLTEKFKSDLQVSETEIESYYNAHKDEFTMPESINIEFILLPLPKDAAESQRAETAVQADAIGKELTATPDLASVAKKYKLDVQTTGFFNREQPNMKLGWPFEVLIKSFELGIDQISEPIETAQGFYFLKLKEKQEPRTMDIMEASGKITGNLLLQAAQKTTQEEAQKGLTLLKEKLAATEGNFTAAGKALGWDIVQTQAFGRGEYLPQIGISKNFQDIAFSLTKKDPLSDVIEIQNGYAILHLDATFPIDEEQFNKDKEEFEKTLLTERKNAALSEYLTNLRLKANLQDNISKQKNQPTSSQPNR